MSPIFYTVVVLSVGALYLISLLAYKTKFHIFFDRIVFSKTIQKLGAYLTLISVLGYILGPHTRYIQTIFMGLAPIFAFPYIFYWMVRPSIGSFHPLDTVSDDLTLLEIELSKNKINR